MAQASRQYPKWTAPRGDGELLIWPEPATMLRQTWENHRQLGETSVQVLGIPLGQLRHWLRRWMGHPHDHQPIIATGHQTELYHPGVWVKNAVIDTAARRIGAVAIHFAVDTDAPKHLHYHWPGGELVLTDDPSLRQARWSGLLHCPTTNHVAQLLAQTQDARKHWNFLPVWDDFFGKLEELSRHQPGDLAAVLTHAHHAVDRKLEMQQQMLVASPIWRTKAYLAFVYDICQRPTEFATLYNAALAEFRSTQGISDPGRPMPDLQLLPDTCEVPFWLDDLSIQQRQRATLVPNGAHWALQTPDGQQFVFTPHPKDGWNAAEQLASWLSFHKLRLAPRALTLTTFLRMLVVDQFTHGIGGGLYDQVTDRLIQIWYGITPPAFSVATATLYFPAATSHQQVDLLPLRQEERWLRQNALGQRKLDYVRQIAAAPRRSVARATIFAQMHRELKQAVSISAALEAWRQRWENAQNQSLLDAQWFNRELPYTLQSRERLSAMISRIHTAFGLL